MPNKFQCWLHAVPGSSLLVRHQRGLLLGLMLVVIVSSLIGLAIGILPIDGVDTSAILLICASLLLGATIYVLPLRQRGHINMKLKQTEAALKASEARLEAQLLQAQKMESIGLLAGGIAHDFNNLLTAISGYTQIVRDTLSPDELVQQDLDEILKATGQAANLTQQLLAFARKQLIEPHVLNLNDLILNLEKLLRRLIGEDVELITQVAPDLGLVKVDPGQIEQVLVNLAVNARQAMSHGGRLTIETHNVMLNEAEAHQYLGLPPGSYVFLTISDTGVGIDLETQARIFEPFFTTKGPGEGSGLGLATCYGIIKQHGGHIGVYSELGHGTCFKIYLPQVAGAATIRAVGREQSELPRGSELVLVVEDDSMVRALTVRVLRQQGYRVLEATDGKTALDIVHEQSAER